MEIFKNWMLSVCGATVIVSFIKIFTSNSTVKKSLNTFFAIFLIFYTIIPLGDFEINSIDISTNQNYDKSEEYKLEGYNKVIFESIESICSDNNIKVLDFRIDSYIDDEGYICVKSMSIDIDNNDKIDFIGNEIKTKTGFEVIVE